MKKFLKKLQITFDKEHNQIVWFGKNMYDLEENRMFNF